MWPSGVNAVERVPVPYRRRTIGYIVGMRYTVIFDAQPDGGYHASCPALPGCHSEGDTLDEATANIREAMTVYLESLQAHGEPLPVEDILIKPLDVAIA